jgi:hypothetical protein
MPVRAAEPIALQADINLINLCISTNPAWTYCTGQSRPFIDPSGTVITNPVTLAALISKHCRLEAWCDTDITVPPLPGHDHELSWDETQVLFEATEKETGVSARLLKAIAYGEGIGGLYSDHMPRQFINPAKKDISAESDPNNHVFLDEAFDWGQQKLGLVDANGNPIPITLGDDILATCNAARDNKECSPTYGIGVMQLTFNESQIKSALACSQSNSGCKAVVDDACKDIVHYKTVSPDLYETLYEQVKGCNHLVNDNNQGMDYYLPDGVLIDIGSSYPGTPQVNDNAWKGTDPNSGWTHERRQCSYPEQPSLINSQTDSFFSVQVEVMRAIRDPFYNICKAAEALQFKQKLETDRCYQDLPNCNTLYPPLTYGLNYLHPRIDLSIPPLFLTPQNDFDQALLGSFYKTGVHAGIAGNSWKLIFLNMIVPDEVMLKPDTDLDKIALKTLVYDPEAYKNPQAFVNPLIRPTPKTDVVFVIDTTGSMGSAIAGARAAAINITNTLAVQGVDLRVALVDYKDKSYDSYASRLDIGFTADPLAFANAVNGLSASGGGDWPEDVYSGLMTAINQPWRNGAKKVIILMGDAGPHNPELLTNYTASKVIDAANAVDPASIYAIRVGSDSYMRSSFQQLADGTGGKTFDTSYAIANVTSTLLSAINSVAHAPSAVVGEFNDPIVGTTGTPVHFDASHSFDSDGSIVKYEWDFNNDGIFDVSTAAWTVSYTYTQAYTGPIILRVTDNDGNTASVKVQAVVSGAATDTAPPVIAITSPLAQPYLHTASLNVGWTATDAGSGVASSTATLDGGPVTNGQTIDLFLLSLGSHTLVVSAADKAGNTASASLTFTVVANINSLIALEQRACSLGWIDGPGVCNSFDAKLRAAKASIDRGQFNTARNQLNAFIAELDAQKDKKVTQGYDVLKDDTTYVIGSLH